MRCVVGEEAEATTAATPGSSGARRRLSLMIAAHGMDGSLLVRKAREPESVLCEDSLAYTPVVGSVPLVRHRAGRLAVEWGHPELAWSAALLVSELATNALLYGCLRDRLFRVRLALTESALRIEGSDPRGERLPVPRIADDEECFGRGLLIVEQVADRWGVEPREAGKTVWCELWTR
ncbi:ATP-binding protein [Streptomyces sp. NPDC096310]|uniref:ATP-binding protein n=1 Tax=Streptomyces sp. NPDC096310 TaxID=3366082 RepID=UPI0037FC9F3F